MRVLFKLALRNLLGAGLRTWLNVIVLSFAFVVIIWTQGIYRGMSRQAIQALTDAEYGGGQYWHEKYDPFNPLSLDDAHGPVPEPLAKLIKEGRATAVLVVQGTLYPQGRFMPVLIKGIDPGQNVLLFPSRFLEARGEEREGNEGGVGSRMEGKAESAVGGGGANASQFLDIPAVIGSRMAKACGLKVGDTVTLRWRDARGAFDARDIRIVQVMRTTVQSIDVGQVWIALPTLRTLTGMEGEATIVTLAKGESFASQVAGWPFMGLDILLRDIHDVVRSKTLGATILYVVLLLLAMLAIFDTQVLSIWRRRKEIGTLMALGMTRAKIIQLFTLEGALHSVLAAIVAAIYGIPFLTFFARSGWAMPEAVDSYGMAIGEKIFPVYTAGLVVGTAVVVMLVTTVVSFLPTRRIVKLKPTEALRGRVA